MKWWVLQIKDCNTIVSSISIETLIKVFIVRYISSCLINSCRCIRCHRQSFALRWWSSASRLQRPSLCAPICPAEQAFSFVACSGSRGRDALSQPNSYQLITCTVLVAGLSLESYGNTPLQRSSSPRVSSCSNTQIISSMLQVLWLHRWNPSKYWRWKEDELRRHCHKQE